MKSVHFHLFTQASKPFTLCKTNLKREKQEMLKPWNFADQIRAYHLSLPTEDKKTKQNKTFLIYFCRQQNVLILRAFQFFSIQKSKNLDNIVFSNFKQTCRLFPLEVFDAKLNSLKFVAIENIFRCDLSPRYVDAVKMKHSV